ncbi:unnamed protein product [Amoebophrya sp. A25]|nr:unnamed protein product [Amoebophrya sp. A25]|eukprot:GSA25T00001347001.1
MSVERKEKSSPGGGAAPPPPASTETLLPPAKRQRVLSAAEIADFAASTAGADAIVDDGREQDARGNSKNSLAENSSTSAAASAATSEEAAGVGEKGVDKGTNGAGVGIGLADKADKKEAEQEKATSTTTASSVYEPNKVPLFASDPNAWVSLGEGAPGMYGWPKEALGSGSGDVPWIYQEEQQLYFRHSSGEWYKEVDGSLVLHAEDEDRIAGVCTIWKEEKGFGFLKVPLYEQDVFVHNKQVKVRGREQFQRLYPGDEVSFVFDTSDDGRLFASDVHLLAEDMEVESNGEAVGFGATNQAVAGTVQEGGATSSSSRKAGQQFLEGDEEHDHIIKGLQGQTAGTGRMVLPMEVDGDAGGESDSGEELNLIGSLNCHYFSEKGPSKDENQDRYAEKKSLPLLNNDNNADLIYMGVFDGHNGSLCAEYMKTELSKNLCAAVNNVANDKVGQEKHVLRAADMQKAYRAAYKTSDKNFLHKARREEELSGSTAVTLMFYGPDEEGQLAMYTAHAGDSFAMLSRQGHAIRLTSDHKPSRPDELDRIKNLPDGLAQPVNGVWRVLVKGPPSGGQQNYMGLAVSRSLGDLPFKETPGVEYVCGVPEIRGDLIDRENDDFVLLGSDGISDVLDEYALKCIVDEARETGVKNVAELVVKRARELGTHDDCTVLVCFFDWTSEVDQIDGGGAGENAPPVLANGQQDDEDEEEKETLLPREEKSPERTEAGPIVEAAHAAEVPPELPADAATSRSAAEATAEANGHPKPVEGSGKRETNSSTAANEDNIAQEADVSSTAAVESPAVETTGPEEDLQTPPQLSSQNSEGLVFQDALETAEELATIQSRGNSNKKELMHEQEREILEQEGAHRQQAPPSSSEGEAGAASPVVPGAENSTLVEGSAPGEAPGSISSTSAEQPGVEQAQPTAAEEVTATISADSAEVEEEQLKSSESPEAEGATTQTKGIETTTPRGSDEFRSPQSCAAPSPEKE